MKPLFSLLGGLQSKPNLEDEQSETAVGTQLLSAKNNDTENKISMLHRAAMQVLEEDLLAHIYAQTPQFFEKLIIDLLLAMGYGTRRRDLSRRLGRSHDGGIDGLICEDELGLEVILVQAKRLKPNTNVSVSQVRDFVGSLDANRACKGVFVSTGDYSIPARMAAKNVSRRVILINGKELAALMVRHNLGVAIAESYIFKTLDPSYFSSVGARMSPTVDKMF
jgi:restriction system protein